LLRNFPLGGEERNAPGIARNAKEREKRRKEAHSGRIRYVVLHDTLLLHVVDHAPLIGTNNEISELAVEKRETRITFLVGERLTHGL
jgi:hypothetical protein